MKKDKFEVPPQLVDQLWRVHKNGTNTVFCSFSDIFSWFQFFLDFRCEITEKVLKWTKKVENRSKKYFKQLSGARSTRKLVRIHIMLLSEKESYTKSVLLSWMHWCSRWKTDWKWCMRIWPQIFPFPLHHKKLKFYFNLKSQRWVFSSPCDKLGFILPPFRLHLGAMAHWYAICLPRSRPKFKSRQIGLRNDYPNRSFLFRFSNF